MITPPKINAYNMDCMKFMQSKPDKYWELSIVDPPYGIGADKNKRANTQLGKSLAKCKDYGVKNWDDCAPDEDYFKELFRTSKNQIIWGANHFISKIPYDSPCWIVWDKVNGENGYADCELAWTSFKSAVRKFEFMWHGMLQENMANKERRIHPTQKPVALYRWLLQRYAKPGDKILDTHGGSFSSAVACSDEGFELDICELDKEYFDNGYRRLRVHQKQKRFF